MGVYLKMKLSAILIAAVSASPVAHDKDSAVAMTGKPMSGKPMSGEPMSGKPMSGEGRPMSGHRSPGHKGEGEGHDMDHDMEQEWEQFQDIMRKGGADNNIMNVNFAPINTNQQNWVNINTEVETDVNVNSNGGKKDGKKDGKDGKEGKEMEDWEEEFDEGYGKDKEFDMEMMKEKMMKMVKGKVMKMMKYKLEMMKPYLPVIKAMIEEMTGMDCEELIAMMEEKLFDGHTVEDVMWAIKNGYISKDDWKQWAMEKWEECEFAQMTEEEKMEWMTEFLGRFGIDCEKVQAGIEEMIGMKFEDIKKMFDDHMADHSGDMDDIDVNDIVDDVMDVFPM